MSKDLVARVEALEKKLGMQAASQSTPRNTLAAEIQAVEERIAMYGKDE